MQEPPDDLDNAKVIKWAWSGERPFGIIGNVDDPDREDIFGLAICQYADSDHFYRFSCDKNWDVVNDALYDSIEEAINELPDQYKEVERFWQVK